MRQNPRYERHYVLKDFGINAQEQLAAAKVLVLGAGGLGCPVLQYVAAAGVGHIGIVDGDVVALSNLQRQVLFDTADVGTPKVEAAAKKLKALNPEVEITIYPIWIETFNALEILLQYHFIVDCTDNFATRYLIGDACNLLNKPLVFGAVYQYEGQLAVFGLPDEQGRIAHYRDLFPAPPHPLDAPDCVEAGVLGVLPGTIGVLMANEVLKLICGLAPDLRNRLFTFDLRRYDSYVLNVSPNPETQNRFPKHAEEFRKMDYQSWCGNRIEGIAELSAEAFYRSVEPTNTTVIDVREPHELPKADFENLNIPLAKIQAEIPEVLTKNIVVFCQSGKRSLEAARLLRNAFGESKNISHIKGGMIAITEYLYG